MKSTSYITGKPREFFEPEITILAEKRIKACKELMAELAHQKTTPPHEDIAAMINRYSVAEESVKWWTKILEEE